MSLGLRATWRVNMFHFCTFKKILTIEKEQNAHTKGEGCYYLLLAVLTEKGKKSCSSV